LTVIIKSSLSTQAWEYFEALPLADIWQIRV